MSFNIYTIAHFDKQFKRLAKKYPSLKQDFIEFLSVLRASPHQGTSLGKDCYKIRLAISSKGKGKSGGARIITYVAITSNAVYLLSIYDKSEQEIISDAELMRLLNLI